MPTRHLSPDLAQVLFGLAESWDRPQVASVPMRRVVWDGSPVSPTPAVEIENDGKLLISGVIPNPTQVLRTKFASVGRISGSTLDRRVLTIGDAAFRSAKANMGAGPHALTGTVAARRWHVLNRRLRRCLWASWVTAPRRLDFGRGNLWFKIGSHGHSLGHYKLKGSYDYYLLRLKSSPDHKRWALVVDSHSLNPPDRVRLNRDMHLLQFLLGHGLHFGTLCQLDRQGQVRGHTGWAAGSLQPPQYPTVPAVPTDRDHYWLAEAFTKLTKFARNRSDVAILTPASLYLDSLHADLNTAYLATLVALEATCRWAARGNRAVTGAASVVSDSVAWHRWVRGERAQIEAHAKSRHDTQVLYARVHNAKHDDTGITKRMLIHWGMRWTNHLQDVVGRRNNVAHIGRVVKRRKSGGLSRHLSRLATARMLLHSSVARVAGYAGELRDGRDAFDGKRRPNPPWWPASSTAGPFRETLYVGQV